MTTPTSPDAGRTRVTYFDVAAQLFAGALIGLAIGWRSTSGLLGVAIGYLIIALVELVVIAIRTRRIR